MKLSIRVLTLISLVTIVASNTHAQTRSTSDVITELKRGGYVIVMRHASSPRETPTKAAANPDNLNLERQLDETGRATASAMGKALRDLKIPVGAVYSSPTYRAMETARLEQWSNAKPVVELGDGGQSMQAASDNQSTWLQKQVNQTPQSGTNTILITHAPNLTRAFPQVSGVSDGEALIFQPDASGMAKLVARIKIEEWPNIKPITGER